MKNKRNWILLVIIVIVSLIFGCGNTNSKPNDISDFDYIIGNDGIRITSYHGKRINVVIPKKIENISITEIGEGAFANREVVSVYLPKTIKIIGRGAFTNCYQLREIKFPSSLEIIGDNAFSECRHLLKVNFPSSLKTIEGGAFYRTGLINVEFPSSLKSIGFGSFSLCENLVNVKFNSQDTVCKGNEKAGGLIYKSSFQDCPKISHESREQIAEHTKL